MTYWGYGSDGEPLVHVAIGVETDTKVYYLDGANMDSKITTLSEYGDFYSDTELSWKQLDKSEIPVGRDLTDRFLSLIQDALSTHTN